MVTDPSPPTPDGAVLHRLMAWFSPAFPIGAYSYSHGLESAVAAALVTDRESLIAWLRTALGHGPARIDAVLLARVWQASRDDDRAAVIELATLAAALRGSSELALESRAQGEAFRRAVESGWANRAFTDACARLEAQAVPATLPVAAALACAYAEIPLAAALLGFLHAFAANLISAAVRLVPLGQSDGQRALAALQADICRAAERAPLTPLDELGSATPMIDWTSMSHETLHTRLFRS